MMNELTFMQIAVLFLASTVLIAFIFRVVLSYGKSLSNQQRIIDLLEAVYKQNGGNLNDLLPDIYKDKREPKQ